MVRDNRLLNSGIMRTYSSLSRSQENKKQNTSEEFRSASLSLSFSLSLLLCSIYEKLVKQFCMVIDSPIKFPLGYIQTDLGENSTDDNDHDNKSNFHHLPRPLWFI